MDECDDCEQDFVIRFFFNFVSLAFSHLFDKSFDLLLEIHFFVHVNLLTRSSESNDQMCVCMCIRGDDRWPFLIKKRELIRAGSGLICVFTLFIIYHPNCRSTADWFVWVYLYLRLRSV